MYEEAQKSVRFDQERNDVIKKIFEFFESLNKLPKNQVEQ